MKNLTSPFRLFLTPILLVLFVAGVSAQRSSLVDEVEVVQAQTKQIPLPIFDLQTTRVLGPDARMNGQTTSFQVNREVLTELLTQRYAAILITIPTAEGELLQLELIQNQIFTTDFQVLENTGGESLQMLSGYPTGLFFKGIVLGKPEAWAAISFFENEIAGVIALDEANLTLALQKDENRRHTNTCLLYDESQLREKPAFSCGVDALSGMKEAVEQKAIPDFVGCPPVVRIYFECDYIMYLSFGSDMGALLTHVPALFNIVSAVYADEGIKVKIKAIQVNTASDPYVMVSGAEPICNKFSEVKNLTGFPGDLAHLLSTRSIEIAFGWAINFGSLCRPLPGERVAFTSLFYTTFPYPPYPTYSTNAKLVTHEIGHNLGSRHTHWCGWPDGPIDNCSSPPEPVVDDGPVCAPGPTLLAGEGTIMSYCRDYDLSNGFGHYPGDTIRNHVAASSCLWPAGPLGPYLSDIGATSANVSWTWGFPPCGVLYYRVSWKVVNANSFITVNTDQTSLNLAGLSPNTNYIVIVDALTTDGVWTDASSAPFVTLPFPVYCASSGLPSTPAWIDKFKLSRFPDLNATKTSGNNFGYADFTSTVFANLKKGATYTTNIWQGYSLPSPLSEYYYIWIDFNKDKDFADPGELVFSKGPSIANPVSGTFLIPTTATTGNTRMRVRMTNTGAAVPCAHAQWGEVEDYTINIVSAIGDPGNGDGLLPGAPGSTAAANREEVVGMVVENALPFIEPNLIPNPVASGQSVLLSFQLLSEEAVQVQVFDLTGQQIWLFGKTLPKGEQAIDLPVNEWNDGAYFVRLQSPGGRTSLKLIVTR